MLGLPWLPKLLALNFLPFGFPALHLFFRDGERLAHGTVEAFGVSVAGLFTTML
jgi:hypothetical protein